MPKTLMISLGALLIAASAVQLTPASARHVREKSFEITEQVGNANGSLDVRNGAFCSQEAGNPYDERTDYGAWSAWRENGSWDSRNDCR